MNAETYNILVQEIESLASEIFEYHEPACDFSEDAPEYEMSADYSELWEDR